MNDPSRDITALDDFGDDLRRQRRLFSEVQEVAHIGIWEWEVDHGRVTWSPELYRIYGVSSREYAPRLRGICRKSILGIANECALRSNTCSSTGHPLRTTNKYSDLTDRSGVFIPGVTRSLMIVVRLRE